MGSPSIQPLPPTLMRHKRIIDYPHTEYVSDFMDIFLISSCRVFIGNNSGITSAAGAFGVPCVFTNTMPFGQLSIFPQDIVIFKLHYSRMAQRLMPFYECLQSHLSVSITTSDYEEFQVDVIENTPEEIRDVTVEMLDRLDGYLHYTEEEEDLQRRFHALMNSFILSYGAISRVGKEFLKKYRDLLILENGKDNIYDLPRM